LYLKHAVDTLSKGMRMDFILFWNKSECIHPGIGTNWGLVEVFKEIPEAEKLYQGFHTTRKTIADIIHFGQYRDRICQWPI
jgi:hypothetical protein